MVARQRVTLRVNARGNDMDSFGSRPGSQGTVRQEVVAGDDGVDQADRVGETAKTPGTFRTTSIVGVTEENRVVEIEDEMARSPA